MKTALFFAILVAVGYGKRSKAKESFECPVACSMNDYRPVCLRGKSYANLCRLQRDICEGKIARGLYEDVEACPGYDKDEDAGGASVEAIDKNGVVFRQFVDSPDNTDSHREPFELADAHSIDRGTQERDDNLSIDQEKQLALKFYRYHAAIDVMLLGNLRSCNGKSRIILDELGPLSHARLTKNRASEVVGSKNLKPTSFWLRSLLD